MADKGHEETEKLLKKMEKQLDEVYKQAYKEARETADDFMKQFRKMDMEKRQLVKDGELDKSEYERWRRTKVFQGNRYHQMADTLAADMAKTNVIAASVINGHLPEVYAINHNYGTYEIEHGGKINTQYSLYDRQTVERLIRDNPDLLPRKAAINVQKDELWNKKHINSAVMQGIIQGKTVDDIANNLAATVTDMSHTSAIRNARTMTTSAQNGGRIDSYKRAQSMGVKLVQVWMATLDSRTRHEHRQLDGQKRKVGEAFEVEGEKIFFPGDPAADPALVYNCFVGDTKVASDSKLIRSYKQEYDGKLVEVKTASGVNFTCTPNHPILTPFGWIGADRLNKGDNILVTVLRDRSALSRYSNIDHVHPCMETLHDAFKRSGAVSRNSPLAVNFHGDIPTTDIEIVTKKRLLRFNRNACFYKFVNKFLLKYADESLVRKCTFMKHFGSVMRTSFSNISRKCKSFPFFWRSLSHSNIHGFRTISRSDAVLTEYPIDNLAAESVIDGELLDRLSGKVFLDKIIDINVCVLKTHVYNLQTKNGYYFANSIIPQNSQKCNGIFAIAKNCRCTLIGEVEGVDYNLSDKSQRDSKLGDMTYEEWKEEKRKQDNAEPPAPKPEPKPEPPKAEDKPAEVEVPAPTVEKPDAVDEPIPHREAEIGTVFEYTSNSGNKKIVQMQYVPTQETIDKYETIGIRAVPIEQEGKYGIGDILPESYDWDFENDTSTYNTTGETLGGSSALWVRIEDGETLEESIQRALEGTYEYEGKDIFIVGGKYVEEGNDTNEVVIEDATAIGKIGIYGKKEKIKDLSEINVKIAEPKKATLKEIKENIESVKTEDVKEKVESVSEKSKSELFAEFKAEMEQKYSKVPKWAVFQELSAEEKKKWKSLQ